MFTEKNLVKGPIENGDAGLVIKQDGTALVFNTFNIADPETVTDEQIETMKNLAALSFALSQPTVMAQLKNAVERIIAETGGDIFTSTRSNLH
jgi:hypothetical protein